MSSPTDVAAVGTRGLPQPTFAFEAGEGPLVVEVLSEELVNEALKFIVDLEPQTRVVIDAQTAAYFYREAPVE